VERLANARADERPAAPSAGPRLRLCFVAPSAYGALSGRGDIEHIGGAEVQQVTLARGLQGRLDVSFVVADHGQPDGEDCAGVTAYKAFAPDRGVRWLRFFHPRLTGLWRALGRADADVYYQRMAEVTTAIVAAFCRSHGRRFVFATAARYDCLKRAPPHRIPPVNWLYGYGLRRADRIFVQTREQQDLLRRGFGRAGVLVRSCGFPVGCGESEAKGPRPGRTPRALWIGRVDREKDPLLAVAVAARCPSVAFDVVGGGGDDPGLEAELRAQAAALPNVILRGYVPRDGIGAFYRGADLVLCTSEQEGFPNVFLEAFSCGVPVVSTVDPDGLIAEHALGRVAPTAEGLAEAVRALTASAGTWRECSERAREYYRRNHDPSVVLPVFERHVREVAAAREPRA
jgi:glycosyltransferase involved in cell wall biosynthesis